MIASARWRSAATARRVLQPCKRTFVATARRSSGDDKTQANDPSHRTPPQNVSGTNAVEVAATGAQDAPLKELPEEAEKRRRMQAPNRATKWAPSQQPRDKAMSGPRFEQTIMDYQPQPYAAIDLIHKQPVRWTHDRVVSCDGGGGPLGHPRIFINLDKPQVNLCTYCGLPFANEHHREHLESLPSTPYPLKPLGNPAEVSESQRVTDEPLGQR